MITLLEQQRAQHALAAVREVENHCDAEQRRRFVAGVEGFPAAILTNGLGQAVATLLAQARRDYQSPPGRLYQILQAWLCRDDPHATYRRAGDLIQAIVGNDRAAYLQAQVEALAYLKWLKTFAVAFLKEQ